MCVTYSEAVNLSSHEIASVAVFPIFSFCDHMFESKQLADLERIFACLAKSYLKFERRCG